MDATSDTAQVEETASRILWPALELVWDEKSNRGDKNSTITVWVWVMICKIDDSSLKLDLAQAIDKWWNVSLNFRTADGKRTELKFPGQISAKCSGWMFVWMLWANPISCGRIIGDRWWMVCSVSSKRHCVAWIINHLREQALRTNLHIWNGKRMGNLLHHKRWGLQDRLD